MAASRADDLALLRAAADEAGALALGYFGHAQKTWTKGVDSIVGEADIAVDERLGAILRTARPDYGWLSEETADSPDRLGRRSVFVVDPIDGTRAFVAGRKEWTVSLAVVEDGRPVVGVLVAPALGESFHGVAGEGAFLNDAPIHVNAAGRLDGARYASSRRYAKAIAEATGLVTGDVRYIPSLAYRLAAVAAGTFDIAIARPNAMDWDLAAADLLVQEAGARLTDFAGAAPRYNRPDSAHPALIATTPALFAAVGEILRRTDSQAS